MTAAVIAALALAWVLLRIRRARKARSAVATGGASIALGHALLEHTDRHRPVSRRFRGSGGAM